MAVRVLSPMKYVVAFFGPGCGMYAAHLFDKYSAEGTLVPDSLHTVQTNNHGVYRYVSEAQWNNFHFWLYLAVAGILLIIIAAIIQIVKRRW